MCNGRLLLRLWRRMAELNEEGDESEIVGAAGAVTGGVMTAVATAARVLYDLDAGLAQTHEARIDSSIYETGISLVRLIFATDCVEHSNSSISCLLARAFPVGSDAGTETIGHVTLAASVGQTAYHFRGVAAGWLAVGRKSSSSCSSQTQRHTIERLTAKTQALGVM